MLDARLRRALGPPVTALGQHVATAGIAPGAVTAVAWVCGVGACVAAALAAWPAALGLWLANRALDGLDGAVARAIGPTDRGAFLDVVADFSIYGGFVFAVAIAQPAARLACAALLVAYYVSGAALLALSSLLARRSVAPADERSLRLLGGLAEGFETIVAYVLFCLLPGSAPTIAAAFAVLVAITAVQRVAGGARLLSGGQ